MTAEAVAPAADLLVHEVPTFEWVEGRRLLVERGSGLEVAGSLERHLPHPEDDLQTVLPYFDTVVVAPAVGCHTVVGHVVPFAGVAAIVERLGAPLEVMTFPVRHDAGPAGRAWDRFDERWLGPALRGVPSGFGNTSLAVSGAPPHPAPRRGNAEQGRR